MTEEKKPDQTADSVPAKKLSILEKAQQKVDVDLGIKDKYDNNEIRSPQARARLQQMKRMRRMILWARRGVYIFGVLTLVYLFARYGFYTFNKPVSDFSKGDKILIDSFTSNIPLVSEGITYGDKVLFYTKPDDGSAVSLGRVFAVEGDEITFEIVGDNYFVKVNGNIDRSAPMLSTDEAKKCAGKVPEGKYLVLDDEDSDAIFDSRQAGFIPHDNIFARISAVWSTSKKEK